MSEHTLQDATLPRRAFHDFVEIVESARPIDVAFCFGASTIGGAIGATTVLSVDQIAIVAASITSLYAGTMLLNDWCDVLEDAINKPHRPIVSGRLSRDVALMTSLLLFVAGIVIAALIHPRLAAAAIVVAAACAVYCVWLKRVALAGNVLAAAVSVYPLWWWLLLRPAQLNGVAALVLGTVVYRVGGELLHTSADRAGDQSAGLRTIATLRGSVFANRLATTCLCAALVWCWVATPILRQHWLTITFGLAAGVLSVAALARTLFVSNSAPRECRHLITTYRVAQILFIAALADVA